MKKYLLVLIMLLGCSAMKAQYNSVQWYFEAGGPPAGEIWNRIPEIPGQQYSPLRELDYDSLNMSFTGNWPFGQSFCVSSSPSGDTVFFGGGGGISIVDATDPYNPMVISEVRARAIIDHSYYDASSQLLFLAAYFSGVEIWDLADITNPVRLCRIPMNSYPRGGIYARDGYLYIVTVADGLYIADISDPANPDIISHQIISGSLVWTSSFDGDRAYISQGTSGMKIVNISNPYDPFIEDVFMSNVTGLQVINDTCYMLSNDYGLCMFDFTDLQNVYEISCIPIEGNPVRLTVSDGFVYIANSTTNTGGGINTVDITDIENPVLTSTINPPETYISGGGNVIAASGNSSGFLLLDISDPANPVYATEMNTAWSMVDVVGHGNYAYTGSNGFRVFDLGDPSYPEQVGFAETDGAIARIADCDTLSIFIPQSMGSGNKVNVMNISDPENPELLGYYSPPVMTYDLVLKDHYAYVACWWDGFRVVNFFDPENPVLASHKFGWTNGAVGGEEWCFVQALDISGNHLWVLDYGPFPEDSTKGIYIWDISIPENPVLINRFENPLSMGHDIAAMNNSTVSVADKQGGLEVISFDDPMNPYTMGYTALPDAAWKMDYKWPFAYVSQYILGGIHIVDVSDPYNPQIAAYYKRSGCFALGVGCWENYALVADGPAGLQVYDNLLATEVDEIQIFEDNQLRIFPNPAKNSTRIQFQMDEVGGYTIDIIDINGKQITQFRESVFSNGRISKEIDLSNLPGGIYLIRIRCNSHSFTGKLIVH